MIRGLLFASVILSTYYRLRAMARPGIAMPILYLNRHTISGFRNTSRYSIKCVAVASERDGVSDNILKVGAFQKCHNSLWHCILTAFVESISGTYFIKCFAKVSRILALCVLRFVSCIVRGLSVR